MWKVDCLQTYEPAPYLTLHFLLRTSRTRMRTFFVVIVVVVASSLALIGCRRGMVVAHVDPNEPVEVVIPERDAYTGAFMDFGDEEDDVTLETIEDFEQMVG